MTSEEKIQFDNLKREVEELKSWKEEKTSRQITFPLDIESVSALNKYFPIIEKEVWFVQPSGFEVLSQVVFRQNDRKIPVVGDVTLIQYIPDQANNLIRNPNHGLENDTQIDFFSTQIIPAGLAIPPYYVVSATADTFKVSATVGGVAVDFTSNGAGEHYYFLQ